MGQDVLVCKPGAYRIHLSNSSPLRYSQTYDILDLRRCSIYTVTALEYFKAFVFILTGRGKNKWKLIVN